MLWRTCLQLQCVCVRHDAPEKICFSPVSISQSSDSCHSRVVTRLQRDQKGHVTSFHSSTIPLMCACACECVCAHKTYSVSHSVYLPYLSFHYMHALFRLHVLPHHKAILAWNSCSVSKAGLRRRVVA